MFATGSDKKPGNISKVLGTVMCKKTALKPNTFECASSGPSTVERNFHVRSISNILRICFDTMRC